MIATIVFCMAVIAGISLLAIGEAFQVMMFSIAATGFWLIVSAFGFLTSAAIWDLYYFLGWMGIAMTIASGIHAITIRNRLGSFTTEEEDEKGVETAEKPKPNLRQRVNDRRKKRQAEKFARTGRMQ